MAKNGWKLIEMVGYVLKWMKMTGNGLKWIEWLETVRTSWKWQEWMEMVGNCCKWLEMA